MKVKTVLKKLKLEGLNFDFCLNDTKKNSFLKIINDENFWNCFAFGYISRIHKKELLKKIEKNLIKVSEVENLMEQSYDMLMEFHFKRIRIREFTKKIYDWTLITNSLEDFELILTNLFSFEDKYFHFYFVHHMYNDLKFDYVIQYVDLLLERKLFDEKDNLYNDLLLYKLVSLRNIKPEKFDYINDENLLEQMCDLTKKIDGYYLEELIAKLECVLLNKCEKNFFDVLSEYKEMIFSMSLLEILNIYELAIYSNDINSINFLNNLIINKDINVLDDNEETKIIYNFLQSLLLKDEEKIRKYKLILEKNFTTFDFKHFTKFKSLIK